MAYRRYVLLVVSSLLGIVVLLGIYRVDPEYFVVLVALGMVAGAFIVADEIERSNQKIDSLTQEILWLQFQRTVAAKGKMIVDNEAGSIYALSSLTPEQYDTFYCAGREVYVTDVVSPLILRCYLKTGGEKSYTITEFKLSPGCILRVTRTASTANGMFAFSDYAHLPEAGLQVHVIA